MLSDTKARQARPREKPYKLADQGGLYLLVSPTGTKSWRYDYRLHGRRETLTLGTHPEVTLREARESHMDGSAQACCESPSRYKRIMRLSRWAHSKYHLLLRIYDDN